ncbi:hypothetical protein LX36DRAFT_564568 [Colletotrichum falcatum]|nr:hypothetical protein LX36DRAFT_564568 [Colletotrichum falcatum]
MADDVTMKDFAVIPGLGNSDQYVWITDKGSEGVGAETKHPHQSLSKRLGRAMKSSLGKVMPSTLGIKNAAQLEFPELEILPTKGGYKDLEAIQTSIATLKTSQRAKMATNPALVMAELETQSKQFLIKKIPVQLQEAEHARHGSAGKAAVETADGTIEGSKGHTYAIREPSIRPVTPANMINPSEGDSTVATATENWVTPASRLSHSPASDGDSTASMGDTETVSTCSWTKA